METSVQDEGIEKTFKDKVVGVAKKAYSVPKSGSDNLCIAMIMLKLTTLPLYGISEAKDDIKVYKIVNPVKKTANYAANIGAEIILKSVVTLGTYLIVNQELPEFIHSLF